MTGNPDDLGRGVYQGAAAAIEASTDEGPVARMYRPSQKPDFDRDLAQSASGEGDSIVKSLWLDEPVSAREMSDIARELFNEASNSRD